MFSNHHITITVIEFFTILSMNIKMPQLCNKTFIQSNRAKCLVLHLKTQATFTERRSKDNVD